MSNPRDDADVRDEAQDEALSNAVVSIINQACQEGLMPMLALGAVIGTATSLMRATVGNRSTAALLRKIADDLDAERRPFDA